MSAPPKHPYGRRVTLTTAFLQLCESIVTLVTFGEIRPGWSLRYLFSAVERYMFARTQKGLTNYRITKEASDE